jgi:hypothetical protein
MYVPVAHGKQVAAAEEVEPGCPYLPAAHTEPENVAASEEVAPIRPYLPARHKEPEHVEAPVICTNIYQNIHTYVYTFSLSLSLSHTHTLSLSLSLTHTGGQDGFAKVDNIFGCLRKWISAEKWIVCGNPFSAPKNII